MKRFANKKVFVGLAVIFILTGVFIFVFAQKENQKPLTELENPQLVVRKKARLLQVFDDGKLIKTFKIALGFAPRGDKEIGRRRQNARRRILRFYEKRKKQILSFARLELSERGSGDARLAGKINFPGTNMTRL